MYNNGYPSRDIPEVHTAPPPPPRLRGSDAWSGGRGGMVHEVNQNPGMMQSTLQHSSHSVGQGYPQGGSLSAYGSGAAHSGYTSQGLGAGLTTGYGSTTSYGSTNSYGPTTGYLSTSGYDSSNAPARYETSGSTMSMSNYLDRLRTPPPPMLSTAMGSSKDEPRRIYESNPVSTYSELQRFENGSRGYSQEPSVNERYKLHS